MLQWLSNCVLYCTAPVGSVLYCIVLYCTVLLQWAQRARLQAPVVPDLPNMANGGHQIITHLQKMKMTSLAQSYFELDLEPDPSYQRDV